MRRDDRPPLSPNRRMLEDAHRVASRPLGQLSLYLERASVPRALTLSWASELRRAAELLDRFAQNKNKDPSNDRS